MLPATALFWLRTDGLVNDDARFLFGDFLELPSSPPLRRIVSRSFDSLSRFLLNQAPSSVATIILFACFLCSSVFASPIASAPLACTIFLMSFLIALRVCPYPASPFALASSLTSATSFKERRDSQPLLAGENELQASVTFFRPSAVFAHLRTSSLLLYPRISQSISW